jgi:hypothetical protein
VTVRRHDKSFGIVAKAEPLGIRIRNNFCRIDAVERCRTSHAIDDLTCRNPEVDCRQQTKIAGRPRDGIDIESESMDPCFISDYTAAGAAIG